VARNERGQVDKTSDGDAARRVGLFEVMVEVPDEPGGRQLLDDGVGGANHPVEDAARVLFRAQVGVS
jgi:hypothetical protein